MMLSCENLFTHSDNLPEPFCIDLSDAAVPVGTGQTYNIPFPTGYLYLIRGVDIEVSANQKIESAVVTTADGSTLPIIPAKSQRGASARLSDYTLPRRRSIPLTLMYSAAGGGNVNYIDDLEFPFPATITRAYWHAGTGTGAVAFTVDVTVGAAAAVTILNNAGANVTEMEAEALNIHVPADTDITVEFTDAGVATADQTLILWFEINETQISFNNNEYIPLVFHRDLNCGALTNVFNPLESPENLVIRAAYAQLGTAMGGGATMDFFVNGYDLAMTITDPAVNSENEGLAIPIQNNADLLVEATESAGAVNTGLTLILICQRMQPIRDDPHPVDVQDIHGDVWVHGGTNLTVTYDQGTTLQSIRTVVYGSRLLQRNTSLA